MQVTLVTSFLINNIKRVRISIERKFADVCSINNSTLNPFSEFYFRVSLLKPRLNTKLIKWIRISTELIKSEIKWNFDCKIYLCSWRHRHLTGSRHCTHNGMCLERWCMYQRYRWTRWYIHQCLLIKTQQQHIKKCSQSADDEKTFLFVFLEG